MECGLHGVSGRHVQRHVQEGKRKDIVRVQIQNLNLLDETAMEGIGKRFIAIIMHVL